MGKIKREQESGRVVWILVFVAASIFILIFFAAKGRFNVPVHNQTVMTLLAPFQRDWQRFGTSLLYRSKIKC